jgi:hypothetical protein
MLFYHLAVVPSVLSPISRIDLHRFNAYKRWRFRPKAEDKGNKPGYFTKTEVAVVSVTMALGLPA